MPQSLSKIYIHLVFSTKGRTDTIPKAHLVEVHAYMAEIFNNHGCPAIQVGGTANHIHVLFLLGKQVNLAEIVRTVKSSTSRWINEMNGNPFHHFRWQDGYGAFSVSNSHVDAVMKYIQGQEAHHNKVSFQDEFRRICQIYDAGLDERYVWDWLFAPYRGIFYIRAGYTQGQGPVLGYFALSGRCPPTFLTRQRALFRRECSERAESPTKGHGCMLELQTRRASGEPSRRLELSRARRREAKPKHRNHRKFCLRQMYHSRKRPHIRLFSGTFHSAEGGTLILILSNEKVGFPCEFQPSLLDAHFPYIYKPFIIKDKQLLSQG